jgi:hypothetical protein
MVKKIACVILLSVLSAQALAMGATQPYIGKDLIRRALTVSMDSPAKHTPNKNNKKSASKSLPGYLFNITPRLSLGPQLNYSHFPTIENQRLKALLNDPSDIDTEQAFDLLGHVSIGFKFDF